MFVPEPNDKQFELPPAGTHLAQCYRVIDLGTQDGSYNGQPKKQHKIMVSWELPDEKMEDGKPFTISQRYTWSMSERAALRKDLESWRGIPFNEKDFGQGGFDIRNIVGKCCLLNIVHTEKNAQGKQYANIASISRLMKGQQGPEKPSNDSAYLWLHEERWEPTVFHKLSDNLKTTIAKSPEYQSLVLGHAHDEMPPVDANEDFHSDPIPF